MNKFLIIILIISASIGIWGMLDSQHTAEIKEQEYQQWKEENTPHYPINVTIVGKSMDIDTFYDIGQNEHSTTITYRLYGLEQGKDWGPSLDVNKTTFYNTNIGDKQSWNKVNGGDGPYRWTLKGNKYISG